MTEWQAQLFAMADPAYRRFHSALIPTVDPDRVIGVRTPRLRQFARTVAGSPRAEAFLSRLPHRYYEENNLHGLLIARIRDYDACLAAVEAFLPYVDNWATCDMLSPPALAREPARLRVAIRNWMASGDTYTVRFGIGRLMAHFLDDRFDPQDLSDVAAVKSGEYYVNMMRAWYFATALAKQYDAALPYLTGHRLDEWTHRMTIRKACESLRVPPEHQAFLRTLRG